MPKLTEDIKDYVIQRLACYDTPTQIVRGVKEEFDVVVTRQQVHEYHPGHGHPAKRLKALFAATRKKFDDGVDSEPATRREVRVRRLAASAERMERAAEVALDNRNVVLAAQLDDKAAARYEQIAKEVGDAFTNKRDVNAKVAGSLAVTFTRRIVRPEPESGAGDK